MSASVHSYLGTAHLILAEGQRQLAASPVFFGVFAFGLLALLLYFVLRIDRD